MKKVFALVLAVAMVMSLAAVSFAVQKNVVEGAVGIMDVSPYGYDYSADSDTMTYRPRVQYGKSIYFPVFAEELLEAEEGEEVVDEDGSAYVLISSYDVVKHLPIQASYEMGAELLDSIQLVQQYV